MMLMEAATDGWRMGGDVGWRLTRDGEFDGNPYAYLKLGLTLSLSLEYGLISVRVGVRIRVRVGVRIRVRVGIRVPLHGRCA